METGFGLDMVTPRNVSLTAFYRRSFAFHTVKNRMPVILTQIVDILVRNKEDIGTKYGPEAQEELKSAIGALSKLRYEIQTNKPLTPLTSDAPDAQFYNNYLKDQSAKLENTTYFNGVWLLSECYMYRRIWEIFELSTHLTNFDPFQYQKEEAYLKSRLLFVTLGVHLTSILEDPTVDIEVEFIKLLKLNLWGNKCDTSLTNGVVKAEDDQLAVIEELNANVLCDHSKQIWDTVSVISPTLQVVDIILDNSGYELFTDLCLADFMIERNLATAVRFYVKTIPWFISDVMTKDFHWLIAQVRDEKNPDLRKLGQRWSNYVKKKTWTVEEHSFWTLPVTFQSMASVDPLLYEKLGESKLVIFKGDLNYRKLFSEKNWDPVTPLEDALQSFRPNRIAALRTLKADIVCGLKDGVAEEAERIDVQWLVNGNFGVIQFCEKVIEL